MLLKAALSRLDVGPAYYEDPVSSNPTYKKGLKKPLYRLELTLFLEKGERAFEAGAQERTSVFSLLVGGSRGSYAAAFPGPFLLVLRPEAIASS